ncbi:SDR family NAD(P)-dependent oxidoreductase [Phytoactinopolyspora limicola]|uniref:SDR family NAD(P)-dependent oxidoreductase n=1 Tax=Phytoactinopolyspora limicola TaxID=2715536 RepID=UPI001408DCD0|nr:SDR family oxidoreductase [Phytoactinopolyspora limicola]
MPTTVVIGGTSGLGLGVAEHLAAQDHDVVLTGRDPSRAKTAAEQIGGRAHGLAVDLTRPAEIGEHLLGIERVDHLVLAAIERDANTVQSYDVAKATRLVTLKLVGYIEVVHTLTPWMADDASIVIIGGLAMARPYPGSTTVSTINGGVSAMVRTLAVELAPRRVNAIHPAMVRDSPYWANKPEILERSRSRTPTGRLATTHDVVDAIVFLLRNPAVNGVNLEVDGGTMLV